MFFFLEGVTGWTTQTYSHSLSLYGVGCWFWWIAEKWKRSRIHQFTAIQ